MIGTADELDTMSVYILDRETHVVSETMQSARRVFGTEASATGKRELQF